MTDDDTQPDPGTRKAGRPPGSVTYSDRWLTHTDAQRKAALARLRMMRDRFERAERAYLEAVEARQQAAADAYVVGFGDREIARQLGVSVGKAQRLTDGAEAREEERRGG